MSDNEIAQQIARKCCVAILLSLLGKKERAQLFMRWMQASRLAPRLTDFEPSEVEQRILREEAELLSEESPFR